MDWEEAGRRAANGAANGNNNGEVKQPPMGTEERYEMMKVLGEGTFAAVYLARDKVNKGMVAIKKIKKTLLVADGVDRTALREIRLQQELDHPNVMELSDVYQGFGQEMCLVFPFMSGNLKDIISDKKKFTHITPGDIKSFVMQTLAGLEYLHSHFILHRDLKPDNLLMSANGVVKLADFGLARGFGSPERDLTPRVVTIWYRAPELLMGASQYGVGVDIWATACIFAELLQRQVFIQQNSESEVAQLEKIYSILGTPSETDWPGTGSLPNFMRLNKSYQPIPLNLIFQGAGRETLALLEDMFRYDPNNRPNATQCLKHRYFSENPPPTPNIYLPGVDTASILAARAQAERKRKLEAASFGSKRMREA